MPSRFSERLRHAGAAIQRRASRLVGRPIFWVVFLAVVSSIPVVRAVLTKLPPPPPVLAQIPEFTLTDQDGRPFGSKDLVGRVWVADFMFTRCPTVCPVLTEKMRQIQHRGRNLGEAFQLVSFSVDPTDTPAVLSEYARQHHVQLHGWRFVTGSSDDVRRTVVDGMKVAMGANSAPNEISHDTHFVLVDAHLRIRGYYESGDAGAIDLLLRDAGLLANRGG